MKCLNCNQEHDVSALERTLIVKFLDPDWGQDDDDFACPHCGAPYRMTLRIVADIAPKYSYASSIGGVPVVNPKDWPGEYKG